MHVDEILLNWKVASEEVPIESPGIYAIWSSQYIHGDDVLVYIGISEQPIKERLSEHNYWLKDERNATIRYAFCDDIKLLNKLEQTLIYVFQPIYNSKHKNSNPKGNHIEILNVGEFHNMLPIVSSEYPWYKGNPVVKTEE